jgi:hypothetical protein
MLHELSPIWVSKYKTYSTHRNPWTKEKGFGYKMFTNFIVSNFTTSRIEA